MAADRPVADRLEVRAPALAAMAARVVARLPAPLRDRVLGEAFGRAAAAFNRADFEAVFALFDADVEYAPPPPLHEGERLRGRAAVLAFWHDLAARFDSAIENLSVEEAEPGRIVRRARLTHVPRAGGQAFSYVIVQTTELASGRVVRQLNDLDPAG